MTTTPNKSPVIYLANTSDSLMLIYYWTTVYDAGPAINQHFVIVLYLLGRSFPSKTCYLCNAGQTSKTLGQRCMNVILRVVLALWVQFAENDKLCLEISEMKRRGF